MRMEKSWTELEEQATQDRTDEEVYLTNTTRTCPVEFKPTVLPTPTAGTSNSPLTLTALLSMLEMSTLPMDREVGELGRTSTGMVTVECRLVMTTSAWTSTRRTTVVMMDLTLLMFYMTRRAATVKTSSIPCFVYSLPLRFFEHVFFWHAYPLSCLDEHWNPAEPSGTSFFESGVIRTSVECGAQVCS